MGSDRGCPAAREGHITALSASYRLQFCPDFTFADAERIVPYLSRLGVSHIYASPIFRSRAGSMHGYDVLDHNEINPELGGLDGLESLVDCAHDHGLGWIQDVVPNHMAYSPENPMLVDLFENAEASRYRGFFDIEWQPPSVAMNGRVVAPFLGDLYGEVLNRGELSLEYGEEGFAIRYYQMRFPLRIETYRDVLVRRLDELERRLGREHPDALKLLGVLYTLESLQEEDDAGARADKVGFVKRMLFELYRSSRTVRSYLEASVGDFNGSPDDPDTFTPLNELHWKQVYRLAYWKVANEEINYRRFFSINDLICLRIEREEVFDHAHRLLFELVDDGTIDGLRVDHIDGLYEPGEYLERLRSRLGDRILWVEKILHPGERLPDHWPVDGTTGYDTLNMVNGLFVDERRAKRIVSYYRGLTGNREEYEAALYDRKRLILTTQMSGDLDNLTRYVRRVVGDDRHGIDITAPSLKRALGEVMVYLPVYRTYVTDRINRPADLDYVRSALKVARQRLPYHGYELDYVETFLLLAYDDHVDEETRARWGDVVLRFQQFTGPLMAKGLEDTLMYGFVPLASVNEVGGSPDVLGIPVREFHESVLRLAATHPRTMTASSTHDTKRGEDVRLRIDAITHHFDEWARLVRQWRTLNKGLRRRVSGSFAPDANDEYLIYQTLVGLLDERRAVDEELADRLDAYLVKSLREAKRHTDWTNPGDAYESAARGFLSGLLDQLRSPSRRSDFASSFRGFLAKIDVAFASSVVAQQLIRLMMPGIPDTYRGAELLDLTLVDPDNRRPVDWAERNDALDAVSAWVDERLAWCGAGASGGASGANGAARHARRCEPLDDLPLDRRKLAVIHLALRLRRLVPPLFESGSYVPLTVTGPGSHGIAFARIHGAQAVITCARLSPPESPREAVLQLPYELSEGNYVDLVSGDRFSASESALVSPRFTEAPIMLLWRES